MKIGCNKMAYSRWLINNRNEYITVPEAETSEILMSERLSYDRHLSCTDGALQFSLHCVKEQLFKASLVSTLILPQGRGS